MREKKTILLLTIIIDAGSCRSDVVADASKGKQAKNTSVSNFDKLKDTNCS